MDKTLCKVLLAILVTTVFSCSPRKIEEKYVGAYCPADTPANFYGTCFNLNYNGTCGVSDKSGEGRNGTCTMSGNSITMSIVGTSESFEYSEFRDEKVTLKIDGNLLTTLTGRQFIKKGSTSSSMNSPSSSNPNSSDSGKITSEKAQNALDRFVSANGSGSIRIKGGVREIPTQNAATAELDVSNFTNLNGRQFKDGRGIAGFSRYTDGKWSLSEVVILYNGFDKQTWTPTIELR